jgi:uncharacterized membrane protein
MGRQNLKFLILIVLCGALSEKRAFAYIDPSAQGLLVQALTPILIILATCVTFLRKQVATAFRWMTRSLRRERVDRNA